jgi:hypothetical protein
LTARSRSFLRVLWGSFVAFALAAWVLGGLILVVRSATADPGSSDRTQLSDLARHLDNLAVSFASLDPALRDAEESIDDVWEDIDDERELARDAVQGLDVSDNLAADVVEITSVAKSIVRGR